MTIERTATPSQFLKSDFRETGDEIDLWALLGTLWRGKWWIIILTFTAVLVGGNYAYRIAVPMFTAKAVVMLESRSEQVTDLTSVLSGLSGDQASINTEVEVLRSRHLIEKLVLALNLMKDPEFNNSLQPDDAYDFRVFIKKILGRVEITAPSERAELDATISATLKTLSISNIRQSFVFQITAVTTSPTKSAEIANMLSELYILDQLEVKFEATQQATTWLTDRVSELKSDLETAEAKVKEFDARSELINAKALAALGRQLKDLRDRATTSQSAHIARTSHIVALRKVQDVNDPSKMAEVANDRPLSRLLSLLEKEEITREIFDARFLQILKSSVIDRDRGSNQIEAVLTSIQKLETQITNQSAELLELQQLQREADASGLIYEYFLGRLKETSVQQGIQQADSRVLSRAVVPRRASAPRKSMILALSAMLGLFAGSGLVLLREMLQNTFRTAEELEAFTGYTVMGQVPRIPVKTRSKVLDYILDKPASQAVEAVRNLRTSILLSNVDAPPKIIMSTSALPGEGKTTQSLILAQNMAAIGKKVLLIEGDIRRRIFQQYFDITDQIGLVSVLSGDVNLEDAIHREERFNLDILIGQKSSINAADLFSSEKFETFLQDLRKKYDLVVIDTPPVLVVPDARVIGQFVDAIIFTVQWDKTSRLQVKQGLNMFESVGLKVTGMVLGQIDPHGINRYYGYGKYGAYGSTSRKYYEN